MAKVKCQISVSADGFVAGPNPSEEQPLGEGGEQLHEWVVKLAAWRGPHGLEGGEVNESTPIMEDGLAATGAVVMGRNMFGGGPGPWGDDPWQGWWGDEPPFRIPVFVLTHHAREPLELGETTVHFVTEGPERAVELAREAAEGKDVSVGGGAQTVQQCLRGGLLDELLLNQVPLLLGAGTRLLEDVGGVELEQTRVVEAPGVAHLFYAVTP
ncbi:MAG TPA: dihydrofolate reductase family protein [Solirubrobacterales bacterium]|nr:dihydrofolate reductase family protein [Solirubrobacterales bacterium]